MDSDWMALSEAAIRVRINRERLLRLVQAHVIEGRRNLTGRWEVRHRSLEDYRHSRNEAAVVEPRRLNRT